MTNIEKLESAIRSALPELMELTEGCEVHYTDSMGHNIYTVISKTKYIVRLKEKNKNYEAALDEDKIRKHCNVIGLPVTLLHLLRWLDQLYYAYKMDSDGEIYEVIWGNYKSLCVLDLSKPLLRDQSQVVIDELVKLIQ